VTQEDRKMAREQDGDPVMGEVSPGETPVGLRPPSVSPGEVVVGVKKDVVGGNQPVIRPT